MVSRSSGLGLIVAPGLGSQALLRLCVTCNLLELITPFVSMRLPLLIDIWKFALDAHRCLDLVCEAKCLKCSKGLYPRSG